MPVTFQFEATGFDEWVQRATNMGLAFNPEPIAAILEDAMATGFQVADARVPVLTGALKASGSFQLLSAISALAVWDIYYALPVEFGHRVRGTSGRKVAAQSFIRPAGIAAKAQLKKQLLSYLKQVVSNVQLVKLPGLKKVSRPRGRPTALVHRYLTKQVTGTRGTRFLYPSTTPTGRFTKVFFPSPRKQLFPRGRLGTSR